MFQRCRQPLAQHLCAGADDAAQARCLSAQATTFARRSTKMRRRWLELNQCPASLIDGPDEPAAEPKPELAVAPTPEEAPAPAPAAPEVAAAPPAPALLADGASCQRSAACASDLCVRGVCVALAMIEIGHAVQATRIEKEPEAAPAAPEPDATSAAPALGAAPAAPKAPVATLEKAASPTRLAPAGGAPDQLREAIVEHEADMKRCVERQLKLVPDLRAEGTLVLEVSATGRVTQAALRGDRLQGTPLEGCMRALATRWVFPRTSRAYAVEAPLKVSGVEGKRP